MSQTPVILIPAAGFGTRVGSPEAKELLPDPSGQPLIESALGQAQARGWPVHVITRAEKKSLIEYLRRRSGLEISIQLIRPSREWPDTLLLSKEHWRQRNILCLPDTRFSPESAIDQLVQSPAELAAAVFDTSDASTWGVLRSLPTGQLEICEKPRDHRPGQKAWGLLAFTPSAGHQLLNAQLASTLDHQWRTLDFSHEFIDLDWFKDLTR
jgi:dTDP-glucose pyrophosphorylase